MKIVVLAGGISTERHVSLVSGTGVCRALRERGHRAILVDMFLGLESYHGRLSDIFDAPDGLCGDVRIETTAPDLEAVRRSRADQSPSKLGKDVLAVCAMADVVFLALHGECGEDGRIQAALDLLGVPYTGANYVSSGMAMDKSIAKRFMDSEGIRTAPWRDLWYTEADIPRLVEELEVPCAVKIVNGGSSVGVELPDTKEELERALHNVLRYGHHAVVEKKIRGRELTVAVLGDRYLPAVEIIPNGDFFNYETKYQSGGATEVCPAPISDEMWRQMGEMALKLHRALGLSVYSRTDFLLDEEGQAWCLEVNTLPGMTPTSLVPKEAAAVGISYGELCEIIVEESLRARKAGR
ncbi:MAG: D-alanine--D-alanine ligase [Ruminococcaceae bacterium]|jgi:D-alanine-D-alanine ligase|nr:D-alanine--D-alanine ligase [Oscillospiraceae bacterium]